MANAEHYSYRLFWSPEDKEFVAVCAEFPSLSHLAKRQAAALKGIRDLVAFLVADLVKAKRPVPEPLTTSQEFKGELRVRLPPNLHRTLKFEAAETGRSLNRLIIDRLLGDRPAPARPKAASRSRRAPNTRAKRNSLA